MLLPLPLQSRSCMFCRVVDGPRHYKSYNATAVLDLLCMALAIPIRNLIFFSLFLSPSFSPSFLVFSLSSRTLHTCAPSSRHLPIIPFGICRNLKLKANLRSYLWHLCTDLLRSLIIIVLIIIIVIVLIVAICSHLARVLPQLLLICGGRAAAIYSSSSSSSSSPSFSSSWSSSFVTVIVAICSHLSRSAVISKPST